ncbi:uncharacterized protein [Oscarella lobularis]|uniref:uncharacterized protein isoform X2 n=1 Tax=Oscarella lobularis TaxID=121494 RepID=UPI003313DF8F
MSRFKLLSAFLGVVIAAHVAKANDDDAGCACQNRVRGDSGCLVCQENCKLEEGYCKKNCSRGYAAIARECTLGYLDLSHLNASASEVNIQYRNSHLALTLIGISSAPGPLENSSGIRFERGGIIDVMNLNTNNGILSGGSWIVDTWVKRQENVTTGESLVLWEFGTNALSVFGAVLLYCQNQTLSTYTLSVDCTISLCTLEDLSSNGFYLPTNWTRVTGVWIQSPSVHSLLLFINGKQVQSVEFPSAIAFPEVTHFGTSRSRNETYRIMTESESVRNVAQLRIFNGGQGDEAFQLFQSNRLFDCYDITSNLLCSRCLPGYYLVDGICNVSCPFPYLVDNATMTCHSPVTPSSIAPLDETGDLAVVIAPVISVCLLLLIAILVFVFYRRRHSRSDGFDADATTSRSSPYEVPVELLARRPSRDCANSFPNAAFNKVEISDHDYCAVEEDDDDDKDSSYVKIDDDDGERDHKWNRKKFMSAKGKVYKEIDADFYKDLDKRTSMGFWNPAKTVEELFEQIEGKQIPKLERKTIELNKVLGSGEFGTVESGQWNPRRNWNVGVAVKTLKSESERDRVKFLKEAAIMSQFNHRNVVSLYGVVTEGDPMMIVLELMENGDLKDYLKKLSAENREAFPDVSPVEKVSSRLITISREIALGMEYLASKSFVHRDLAARNVFLDYEFTCKIGDFGLARDLDDDYYVVSGGKIPVKWTAPEALSRRKYTTSSDVWSYGIVLYEIWTLGESPYQGMKNTEVVSQIERGYRMDRPAECSEAVYALMMDCWNEDHHSRPSFRDIIDRISLLSETSLSAICEKPEEEEEKEGEDKLSETEVVGEIV